MKKYFTVLGFLCLSLVFFMACEKSSPTTPEPPPPPPTPSPTIAYFTADPEIIAVGDYSMLDWKTTDASTVSIDNGIGVVSESMIEFVSPEETTTYTLTATNSVGSVTAKVKVEVRGADLQVVGAIQKKMLLGWPTFEGFVKNFGNNIAWNAGITFYCYGDNAQTLLIDTAWGYLVNGGDIRPGEKVPFEAICFDLESHSQIKSRRIELDWLEGDISSLSNQDLEKLHDNQRRAQELEIRKARAEMEKRGRIY